jgi:hypothetical protein
VQRSNYFAFTDQDAIKTSNEEDYLKKYNADSDFITDSIYILENKPNQIKIREILSVETNDDNFLYLKPFVHVPFLSNPFIRENRKSNIDFPFIQDYKFVTIITVKDGYTYEVPANFNAILNENSISMKYSTSYNTEVKRLTILADMKIFKTSYTPEEYPDLRAAFEAMVNKLNEPVILKKM